MLSTQKLPMLYSFINSIFCVFVVLSNIISAKMIKLPFFFDYSIPAGLLIYPFTFLLSDLVTEIYGEKKAKFMVYMALATSVLSFFIIKCVIMLPSPNHEEYIAFKSVLELSGLRIFSSITAYVFAQIIGIQLYVIIKNWTGDHLLWLRNNGSTCISQLIDTILIDIIYLYWGIGMDIHEVFVIIFISYAYKTLFSIANTPLFYMAVFLIRKNRVILNDS